MIIRSADDGVLIDLAGKWNPVNGFRHLFRGDASRGGPITQIVPAIIDDPNTVAISLDVTIPATS